MERRMTRTLYQHILKNQPKIVVQRIKFSNIKQFGVTLNSDASNGISKVKEQNQLQQEKERLSMDMSQAATQTEKRPKTRALAFNTAPRKQIIRNVKFFVENEIILVKWPYFPNWPAMITAVEGKLVHVKFFGNQG